MIRHESERVESLEQFRKSIDQLVKTVVSEDERIIVMVDDVDRCLPEQGLEIFEAIKLFLDVPGLIFIVAMDQEVLQHALDLRYKQENSSQRRITAETYAEKMIDLNFSIPLPSKNAFQTYIKDRLTISDCLITNFENVRSILPHNPRTWQRFADRAEFHLQLLTGAIQQVSKLDDSSMAVFLKTQLLSFKWPLLSRALMSVDNVIALEQCTLTANVLSDAFLQETRTRSVFSVLSERAADLRHLPAAALPLLEDISLLRFVASPPLFSKMAQGSMEHLAVAFEIGKL